MVLEVCNLSKSYFRDRPVYKQLFMPFGERAKTQALDSVRLCAGPGQIVGLVGANGAGKTTLLRILADLLEADEGTVKITGIELSKHRHDIRKKIGYVSSDERSFFWRLTGRENLAFFAALYGLGLAQANTRVSELLRLFDFQNKADQLFRDYSAGMRKKVSIMRALLHKPPLLLLDEITNSLDPFSTRMVMDLIRGYVSEVPDRAAVWSTHRLEEIAEICDSMVMIQSGKQVHGDLDIIPKYADANYRLKVCNLDGQLARFRDKIGIHTKLHLGQNGTCEFLISGIDDEQFSEIISMAVKEFDVCVLFAGRIKEDDTP